MSVVALNRAQYPTDVIALVGWLSALAADTECKTAGSIQLSDDISRPVDAQMRAKEARPSPLSVERPKLAIVMARKPKPKR